MQRASLSIPVVSAAAQFSVLCCNLLCSFAALPHFCLEQSIAWEE